MANKFPTLRRRKIKNFRQHTPRQMPYLQESFGFQKINCEIRTSS